MTYRKDDWASTTGSIGGSRDKHRGIYFARRPRLHRRQLLALYEQNGLIARLVDQIVDDSLREGWELTDVVTSDGSTPNLKAIYSMCDDLGVNEALSQAGRWSRLFGGALLALPVYDRRPPEAPMSPESALDIYPLKVVDAYDAQPQFTDADWSSPTYLKTLDYNVNGIASESVLVHHTRVIPFEAVKLPARDLLESHSETGWGPSVIERVYDEIARDGAAASHAVAMMYISSLLHVGLKGYEQKFKTKGGPEKIQEWAASFRSTMDSLGLAVHDSDDTVANLSLSVTGAHELLDKMRDRLASIANMPREILFNESPAGLNAGQLSGPQELWFQKCGTWQQQELTPALDRILETIFAVRKIPIVSWSVNWRPLYTRTPEADAEVHSKNAVADTAYVDLGLDPGVVLEQRFGRGNRGQISLPEEAPEAPLELNVSDLPPEPPVAPSGIDVTAAIAIVEKVTSGAIPRDAGAALLAAAGFSPALLGSAGSGQGAEASAVGPSTDAVPADVVSVQEAATAFSVPTRAITKALEDGRLQYWGIGAHRRVSMSAVAAMAKGHESPPEAPNGAEATH